jgi:lipase maturation factor 1
MASMRLGDVGVRSSSGVGIVAKVTDWKPASVIRWLLHSACGDSGRLIARWIFLRGLGLIYFSGFFSLIFQIRGLIGPTGILPAGEFLRAVAESAGRARFWYAPTVFWVSTSSHMLMAVCWIGIAASILVVLNAWPRGALFVCFVCFLSFVTAAGEFSGYQSDGMLLEAGFIALFFAPHGLRPGWGGTHPPIRASVFLLLWEWFRIYFESGLAKIVSGDPKWRQFTAMDEYYQNGPLPTWIGWYVQHLPHWFHAATAIGTLALELVLVWMLFLPRRWRMVCFFIVTPWQIGIILTANYAFLNYLVLMLGFLLLDDRFLIRFVPQQWRETFPNTSGATGPCEPQRNIFDSQAIWTTDGAPAQTAADAAIPAYDRVSVGGAEPDAAASGFGIVQRHLASLQLALTGVMFAWIFYASTVLLLWMLWPGAPLPSSPVVALEPFRIADRYGLFATMTRGRYEIEFQGSQDGQEWLTYPFRYKPQDPTKAPGIYAPYQPRFDWNLWFASLGEWRSNPIVPRTEERLLTGSADVLALVARNPFPGKPPRQVRAVIWQYWFSTPEQEHTQGVWWTRQLLGLYAPTLQREADGKITVAEWPRMATPRE